MGENMVQKKASKSVAMKKPVKSPSSSKKGVSSKNIVGKLKKPEKTTDLPTAAVIRIAKASGAERVGSDGALTILTMTEDYIGKLTKEAILYASNAGRKTIREEDVEMASRMI
jgi:DNA-binding protein